MILDKPGRYINQPEPVRNLKSDEFMHGYNDGFGACRGDNDNSIDDDEDGNLAKDFMT